MFLYTTTLYIDKQPVRYEVIREEGNKIMLLYKPVLPLTRDVASPIFWVGRQDGHWVPFNLNDASLVRQVLEDLRSHYVE